MTANTYERALKRMLDGFVHVPVLAIPPRCACVELIPAIRFGLHQLSF